MKRAFTLLEVLVVVGIISLLMALALPVFKLARERAAETVCQSQLRQMAAVLKTYCSDHDSRFPPPPYLYHSQSSFADNNYPRHCRWHDPVIGPASSLFREHKSYQGSLIPYIGSPRILLCKTGARANLERGCNVGPQSPHPEHRQIPIVPQYTYAMNKKLNGHLKAGGWPTGSPMSHLNPRSVRIVAVERESQVTRNPSEVFAFGEENSWFVNPRGLQGSGRIRWPAPYNLSSVTLTPEGIKGASHFRIWRSRDRMTSVVP